MGALLQLMPDANLPAVVVVDAWAATAEHKRAKAGAVAQLVRGLPSGVGALALAATLRAQLVAWALGADEHDAQALAAAKAGWIVDGKVVSVVTIARAILAHRKAGSAQALVDKRQGRTRLANDWDVRAAHLWMHPAKRGYANIARVLRQEGYPDVTARKVQIFVQGYMPGRESSKLSAARIGKHLHKLNRRHYVRRNLDEVLVGEIYAGDGHTCDVYVAHPSTGGLYRPELTAFIDIKSRMVVGWWLSESETKESTLFALSAALVRYNHVNAWVYIDHGAGYRAKMMSDESTGFYKKFDMAVTAAIPGNPNGKAWIERFFKTFREDHDKFFADGMTYCGDDMAPEINRRLSVEVKQGKRKLPSYQSYVDSVRDFMDRRYPHEPMRTALAGRTPAQVWAELVPVPLHMVAEAVMRPRVERVVSHQEVRLHNRHYYAEQLADYDAQSVMVEYDLHNDSTVWIKDKQDCTLCEAKLVHSVGVLSSSRLEDQKEVRKLGQIKRLERHAAEAQARRFAPIDAESQAQGLQTLLPAAPLALPPPDDEADFDLDLTNWRKD